MPRRVGDRARVPGREVALARVRPAVPKSASGRTVQPCDQQAEGASTIHSAELTSTAAAVSVRVKRAPVGRSASAIRT
jgi:hypothetical protein